MTGSGWHRKRTTPAGVARARDYASREHRTERARRVAAHTPASPCSRCHRPLGPITSAWHLPHRADRQGYEPGLWCADCNRREAASRGARIANARRKVRRASTTRLTW